MGNKFAYLKFEFDDLDVIRDTLTKEQGMDLICAIEDYAKDGTIIDVPSDARAMYALLRKKIDRSQQAYEEKCRINAENAAKGGKAKARNAKEKDGSSGANKFKPPTLKQFKNAVDEYADDVSDYDIESFYDHLNESKWQFEGMAIQSRKDWEQIISARFCNNSRPKTPNVFQKAFSYLISAYPRLHHRWDDVNSIIDSLIDGWDIDTSTWIVEGRAFKVAEWKEALDILAAAWIEDIPP